MSDFALEAFVETLTPAEMQLVKAMRALVTERIVAEQSHTSGGTSYPRVGGPGAPLSYIDPSHADILRSAPCGEERDGKVCIKSFHSGKHTFRPKPHVAPSSRWHEINTLRVGRFTVQRGSPVKVLGFGRKTELNPKGAAQGGWTITKIETCSGDPNCTDPEEINVTLQKRGENTRVVKADKIVYVRPKR